jgi:hypothetical protein
MAEAPTRAGADTWPEEPILLYASGPGTTLENGYGYQEPPYGQVAEVVLLITLSLQEGFYRHVETARSLESGVVEEYAVAALENNCKRLIFRVWPVFFAYPKRVDYKFYVFRPALRQLVLRHLQLLASINEAELVEKP